MVVYGEISSSELAISCKRKFRLFKRKNRRFVFDTDASSRLIDRSVIDREETWHPSFSGTRSVKPCLHGCWDAQMAETAEADRDGSRGGEGEPMQPSDVADRRSQHVHVATGPHMSPFTYRCIPN